MKKKHLPRMPGLLLAALLLAQTALAGESVAVTVDGAPVPAFVEGGTTYVQLSPLLEAIGGWETAWDHHARGASAGKGLFTPDVPN